MKESTMAPTNSCINNITTNSSNELRIFEILPHYSDFIWLSLVIFIFLPNTYLLLVITCTRRLRTRSNALISSLAMLDIVYALFYILPMSVLLILHHHGHRDWTPLTSIMCQSAYSLIRPILDFNINLHICVISLEQFIAIGHPFKYQIYINNNIIFGLTILTTYTLSILLGAVPFIADWYSFTHSGCTIQLNNHHILITQLDFQVWNITCIAVLFPLPFLTIVMFYTKIYGIANHHFRRTLPNAFRTGSSEYRIAVNKKAATAIAILLADIVILRLPHVTVIVILYAGISTTETLPAYLSALLITQMMSALTSVVNPFLYSYYNKDLRKNFYKKRWCYFYPTNQMASTSSTTRISRLLLRPR